ncbi:biosynthetic arginine decarboxylase [Campylobacter sp. JMF_01 NE2]|uniref:biosynthetic arginine decarboxylase n=1 Tax=unclassified Campylobacter TaxID=2593542 RepID=UPI0022E9DD17|nr:MULTISPECIES: biosynthetic arginine decarboxylase [unclassified Campylobacter]MDA3046500.1 biosynthetic arginine decarboxylase [Campylobacter sp. VBCF_06 NA8]MDA3052578.1 biosynthetic arginine decarboxylase [Campylobacter sp. JMF_03 NE3]MDA3054045.1 biosynthetic arginine decarboxylase [Campylobacter sp. VBCF_07 NA4]MDA3060068.1 biosynthetic arginine decarboxylase [Campylobacter sp. VBCF_02 NA5]MDA3066910.1 biosynthetic arginine decarboxylase [Campylobacter sp. JMF_01 NE2]
MNDYGLNIWGNSNFVIDSGKLCVNSDFKQPLVDMVKEIRADGIRGPILLRFPHLIKKQIVEIYSNFNRAIKEFDYKGKFNAVYPLKVNQFPGFVKNLVEIGKPYGYGLEAGSKPELLLAMAYNNDNAPITVNGFKDKELINIGFIAAEMGHNITLTIEGLNELKTIIETAKERFAPKPFIGLRIRLHNSGSGIWVKSGGINSKFGLTSTELIEAVNLLKKNNLIEQFTMIHFHIGSQITEIHPLKKALVEAGNIYAELRKMGAKNLNSINLGGGLAIEYSQVKENFSRNYTLKEYANDVVFLLKSIAQDKNEVEPNIFIESGRYVAASHAVLVAPVLELFTQEYTEAKLALKKENPPVIAELYDLYTSLKPSNALEYLHDAMAHMESVLTLFDLGYVDLTDRSNGEILVHLVVRKAYALLGNKQEYGNFLNSLGNAQERYLVNFSLFQSLPDFWGIKQHFPVMPLEHLDERATLSATLWDITCDSDGEITFDKEHNPLFLHDIDPEEEEYFLGFFLVGAYQEVLGMNHNLFAHPNEATVILKDGGFEITDFIESQSVIDILDDMDYDVVDIRESLNERIANSPLLSEKEKKHVLGELYLFLNDNSYLKTIQ